MIELTNREWGTVILTVLVVAALLTWPKTRGGVLSGVLGISKAFTTPKILLPLALFAAYFVGVVFLARQFDVWSGGMLKDTVIIGAFVGLPLFLKSAKIKGEVEFIADVARDPLRISGLLVFYLNLASLAIWAEVLVQAVLGFLILLRTVGSYQDSAKRVVQILDVLIAAITLWLVINTAVDLVQHAAATDWIEVLTSFLLSIWLPLLLVPFIYALALYAAYEQVVVMLPFFNDHQRPRIRTIAALVAGSRLRTAYASRFTGKWRADLAVAPTFRSGLAVMRNFRLACKDERLKLRRDRDQLQRFAGVIGTDEAGLQLDRRDFKATKRALDGLYFMELGWHRNQLGHYRGDLVQFLTGINTKGLPSEHGIKEQLRKDKQAWKAWRRTPIGYVFAVGGTRDLNARWQFDGAEPPTGFPSAASGWRDVNRQETSLEWGASEPEGSSEK